MTPAIMQPLRRMWKRVERTANESDATYFTDLLKLGELLTKLVVSPFVSSVDNRDYNRHDLELDLVHADSLGQWIRSMDDTLVGPSAGKINKEAWSFAREITSTKIWKSSDSVWQREALELLNETCAIMDD